MKSTTKVVHLLLDFMHKKKVNGTRDHNPIREGSLDALDLMRSNFVNFNKAVTNVDTSRKRRRMKRKKLSTL